MDEEKQRIVWKLSGGYTRLEGYEPLTATPPRPPESAVANDAKNDATPSNDPQQPHGESSAGAFVCLKGNLLNWTVDCSSVQFSSAAADRHFLPRDAMLAQYMLWPSVRLSVSVCVSVSHKSVFY